MSGNSNNTGSQQPPPIKPWRRKRGDLPNYVMDSLYRVYYSLPKQTRERIGLMMKIPVFIQDPLVALENPQLGVQEIEVRLEAGFGDGPTSSRIAVVDFNGYTETLTPSVAWDRDVGWFYIPQDDEQAPKEWLPDAPKDSRIKKKQQENYRQFVDKTVKNPHFHQVNVWAIVQRVLEFYEEPQALGRPIPWGFDGNRLLVVPHAGYGENAFYDQNSKSLQFYYFGDINTPGYTCLSHDVIAHETGHAILDGVRPLYNQLSSVQTGAFHEFIGDLTAILLALFNKDIRHFIAETTKGKLEEAEVLANIAEQFGEEVEDRPYLRTAVNDFTMQDVQKSMSPHQVSQVLTGAMFEILVGIAANHMEKNIPEEDQETDEAEPTPSVLEPARKVTPLQAVWWAADRFRRVALQPLDLCPPCDIQFIDYARAVIRNDALTDPVDEQGYRQIIFDVFHKRGLCTCGYQPGQDLPANCQFQGLLRMERMDFVKHNIERLSSSRTAAYYFLSDNRKVLRIPAHQDVVVADLYDNSKFGAAAERLPREIVLEYTWQERISLANDPEKKLEFGEWDGKSVDMICGGTLVFDGRGNLLSWLRKPGTELLTDAEEDVLCQRIAAWQADPKEAKRQEIKRPTKQELGELSDQKIGRERKAAFLKYVSSLIRRGLVGQPQPESRFSDGLKAVQALEDGDLVRFETTPYLRKSDFEEQEEGWTVSY